MPPFTGFAVAEIEYDLISKIAFIWIEFSSVKVTSALGEKISPSHCLNCQPSNGIASIVTSDNASKYNSSV